MTQPPIRPFRFADWRICSFRVSRQLWDPLLSTQFLMRLVPLFLLLGFCLPRSHAQDFDFARVEAAIAKYPFRTWTDDTGKHKTTAKYIGHNSEAVMLLKENYLLLSIPLERLSKTDRHYLNFLIDPIAETKLNRWANLNRWAIAKERLQVPGDVQPERPLQLAGKPEPPNSSRRLSLSLEPPPSDSLSSDTTNDSTKVAASRGTDTGLPLVELSSFKQEHLASDGLLKPLAENDLRRVHATLDQLSIGWPSQINPSLRQALIKCAQSGNLRVDEKSLGLLVKAEPHQHLDLFRKTILRSDFSVRAIAYEGLAAINSDQSLDLLLQQFDSTDVRLVGKLLPSFESRAESRMLEFLNHHEVEHVLVSCSVLGDIGTEQSLESLGQLARNSDSAAIRTQSQASLSRLRARLQSLPENH